MEVKSTEELWKTEDYTFERFDWQRGERLRWKTMVVKCKKTTALLTTTVGVACGLWFTISFIPQCIEYEIYFMLLVVVAFWLMVFYVGVDTSRSLVMDEEGCTVRYLFIRKRYLWNELKIKRIEHYRTGITTRGIGEYYTDAVIFSKYHLHKPKWLHPHHYVLLASPFFFFYVEFALDGERLKKAGKSPEIFEVNEDEFLARMKAWGVELEDTREKAPQRRREGK